MINNIVTPVEECLMCGEENIRLTNICPINNPDHKICKNCVTNLKEKYNKEFCAYCGERPIIINTSINPVSDSINIIIEPNREDSPCEVWRKKHKYFINIFCGIVCYIGLILNWHLYKMIDHFMETGNTLYEDIDWHIYNAFYAFVINISLLFFINIMCEKIYLLY